MCLMPIHRLIGNQMSFSESKKATKTQIHAYEIKFANHLVNNEFSLYGQIFFKFCHKISNGWLLTSSILYTVLLAMITSLCWDCMFYTIFNTNSLFLSLSINTTKTTLNIFWFIYLKRRMWSVRVCVCDIGAHRTNTVQKSGRDKSICTLAREHEFTLCSRLLFWQKRITDFCNKHSATKTYTQNSKHTAPRSAWNCGI